MIKRLSFTVLNHLRRSQDINPLREIQKCKLCTAVVQAPKKIIQIEPSLFDEALSEEELFEVPSILSETNEDFSDQAANVFPSFNLAPFVNNSETLQNMIKLGVDLHKISRKPKDMEFFMGLDFEKDMKPYLRFLGDYVEPDRLGYFITKNPVIFGTSLDDLQVRINYLKSKRFASTDIKRIVSANPFWLLFR